MTALVSIGGIDAATLGLSLVGIPDGMSAPDTPWDTLAIPQRPGLLVTRQSPEVSSRILSLDCLLRAANVNAANTALDTVKGAVYGRETSIVFSWQDADNREYRGYCQSITAEPFLGGAVNGWLSVRLSFLLASPFAQDDADTVEPMSGAEDVLVGTASTECRVVFVGPGSNPTLTIRDYTGAVLGSIGFTVSLADANDTLTVDAREGGSATVVLSTVASNAMPLVSIPYRFPVFTPQDADRVTPDWPTLEAGGASATLTYRRRWL
jgi:hypothetical protein